VSRVGLTHKVINPWWVRPDRMVHFDSSRFFSSTSGYVSQRNIC